MPCVLDHVDFDRKYVYKTVAQLRSDSDVGIFAMNGRIVEISRPVVWWYPICACHKLFEGYIGAFYCEVCRSNDFYVKPRYMFTVSIEDETGLDVFVVSVVFIVKKVLHSLDASHVSFDVLNMSSDESVRKRFVEDGMVYVPYKAVVQYSSKECSKSNQIKLPPPTTLTEYLSAEMTSIHNQCRFKFKWEMKVTRAIAKGRNVLNFPREYSRNCLGDTERMIYLIDMETDEVLKSSIFTSSTNAEDRFIYSGWKRFVKGKRLRIRDTVTFTAEVGSNIIYVQVRRKCSK
ncbi:hypothetical protein P8452_17340 [Trifolium repens]|nr:hypothetical protein P8452_17340 [Trifolium repens]